MGIAITSGTFSNTSSITTDSLSITGGTVSSPSGTWNITGNMTSSAPGQFADLEASTWNIAGNLLLNGSASHQLDLTSSTTWTITVGGSSAFVSYADVQNSNASLGRLIIAADGTSEDLAGNQNWLFAYVLLELGLAAYLGEELDTDIYPVVAPQTADLPFIVYQRISTNHEHDLSGSAGIATASIQFTICGDSFADVQTIARELRTLLHRQSGVLGGVLIYDSTLEGMADLYQPPVDASDTPVFQKALDFAFQFQEVVPNHDSLTGSFTGTSEDFALSLVEYLQEEWGTSVYFLRRPQGSALPCLVLRQLSDGTQNILGGDAGFALPDWQIEIIASTYALAKTNAETVRLLLQGLSKTIYDCDVFSTEIVQENDAIVRAGDGSDGYYYSVILRFAILHGI